MSGGIVGMLIAGAVVIGTMAPASAAQHGPVDQPSAGLHSLTRHAQIRTARITPATGTASIGGTITMPVGVTATPNEMYLILTDTSGNEITHTRPSQTDGSYTFPGLAAGTYKLFVSASDADQAIESQWWTGTAGGAADIGGAATITLTSVPQSVNVALTGGGSTIQGSISSSSSTWAAAMISRQQSYVCAFRDDNFTGLEHCATPAADGSYSIAAVRPGNYKIGFMVDGYGVQATIGTKTVTALGRNLWWNSKPDYNSSDDLTVADATTVPNISQDVSMTGGTPTFPTVSGTPQVGQKLTAQPGVWTSDTTGLTYVWLANGIQIAGAGNGPTYTLAGATAGKTISVAVLGQTGMAQWWGADDEYGQSDPTSAVTPGTLKTATPTISGTPAVGYSLTANHGTWTSGTSFTYQWFANGAYITGSTSTRSSFKLTSAQQGKNVTVKVIGKQTGYTTASKTSGQTGKVALTSNPVIVGTLGVGHTLSVHTGTWTRGTSFQYQWYANGVAIRGATGHSFTLTSAQRYKTIKVKVTGRLSGYATVTRWTASTARIS